MIAEALSLPTSCISRSSTIASSASASTVVISASTSEFASASSTPSTPNKISVASESFNAFTS